MGIKILVGIIFTFLTISVFGRSRIDSVGVENAAGKKIILHKVEPRDSYYAIARKYNVKPKAVADYNNNKGLRPGDLVKVPTGAAFSEDKPQIAAADTKGGPKASTKTEAADPKANTTAKSSTTDPKAKAGSKGTSTTTPTPATESDTKDILTYKVGPRETLYSISKQFNVTIDELKTLNQMKGNSLAVGQLLKIKYYKPQPDVAPAQPVVNAPNMASSRDSIEIDTIVDASQRLKLPPYRYGLREVVERGVAAFMIDETLDDSKMLALHRTAPVGTVIKITNPMSNKTTFAKVVGKFTDNEATKDVIIVVNKATANLIGAIDKRFQVTIVYGVPNE